ncbi:PAS domain S-box-containing protein [Cyclobacterium lianum]|uniref:histidine kinase n=1 Tax=Cyclobacterium lianum TaxID=388280 RepID=A0A1M7JHD2_9BACT|nr:PAS domain S-box protein [Cyclobacterium lianum]SHM52368.1 PAS domain S-box-containing protein [Cyclobacterium lianum]
MHQQNQDYSSFFHFNPVPCWVFDPLTFKIQEVNLAALRQYGYTAEEFLKLNLRDLHADQEIMRWLDSQNGTEKQEGNIPLGVCTHRNKSGEPMRMEVHVQRMSLQTSGLMIAMCRKVSAEEKQHNRLPEAEKMLSAVSNIGRLGYWRLDLDGRTLAWTEEVYRIWGRQPEDFAPTYDNFYQTIHPEDRDAFGKEQWQAFEGRKNLDFVHRILLPDQEIRWVHERGRLIKDSQGIPIAFEGTVQDITRQKEVERQLIQTSKKLSESEKRFRIAQEISPDGFTIFRPIKNKNGSVEDFIWIFENQAVAEINGTDPNKIIGKKLLEQFPKHRATSLFEAYVEVAITGKSRIIDEVYTGEIVPTPAWLRLVIVPMGGDIAILTQDITERKLAEDALRESEARFRTIFEIASLGIAQVDVSDGRIILVNSFYESITGYSNEALLQMNFPDLTHPDDRQKDWELFCRAARGEEEYRNEKRYIKKDGTIIWVRVHVAFIRDQSGKPKHTVAICEEITAQKQEEQRLRLLENDLSHLYQATPDVLCLTDLHGNFLKINKAGCELLGYSEEEILHHPFEEFVHPEDRDYSLRELKKVSGGENSFKFENRILTKAGNVISLSWTSNIATEDGLIYATAKDITEQKKLRELNRQASKLARIGSWEIDLAGNALFWSDMVYELHDTDPDSFEPDLKTAINFYREDFLEMVNEKVNQCQFEGVPFDFEAVLVTAKQREKWVRVIGHAEMVEGRCQRIFGSFQDIHDRKEAEFRLQSLADNLPGVVFQYHRYPDGSDALKYVTKGSLPVWGFSPEEVIANNRLVWDQISAAGDLAAVQESIVNAIKTKTKWTARWKYVLPSGEIRTHLGNGSPRFLADGSVAFNSVILDITNEARNEELLEQATDMAQIGSWELDLVNPDNDAMYWSPMTRKIIEVDEQYNPSLTGGFEFYIEKSKSLIQSAVDRLILDGKEFDEELLIRTGTGKEKWIRCIGKSERIRGKCVKIYGSFQDIHMSKTLEIRIQEILDSISDAFYAVDGDWNFTYFNREAENLLQKKAPEVIGKSIWKEFPAAIDTSLDSIYHRVVLTKQPTSFEYFFPGDGNWYEVNVYPSADGLSAYFKNINERKQAAVALEKAYQEKNDILESIGDAFFSVNRNWKVTYWNREAENFLGRKRADILGENLWDKYADAIDSEFYHQYHYALEKGEKVNFEAFYPTVQKWFGVSAYPSKDGLSVYFKDITLRKQADIRLKQANERFEKVAEATNDAIWDWNLAANTLYWGGGFEKLFGYQTQKIIPTEESWYNCIHPDDRERVKSSRDETLINPERHTWTAEYRFQNIDDSFSDIIDRGKIIRDRQGKAIRMVGAMTDITERKRFEQQLLELNQSLKQYTHELELTNEQLEQFAFIASHDLQEPLRMISSFMDQLKRKYGDRIDEKGHQYIHYATDGAKRMKQIILDLLEYSRAGKLATHTEKIKLSELIGDYQLLRRKIIAEKSVKLSQGKLPEVQAYKAPLTQTLHCLLDNAIKYSREHHNPEINLHVEDHDDFWKVCIADRGIGIDPKYFEKIFIIFQRLHNREQYSGTGIGLSIAKKHVESWGGKIWLESTPGKGSEFYFTIPKTKI